MEQELSTLDEFVQKIIDISKAVFKEVMEDDNVDAESVMDVTVDRAVNHIIKFDDEPFTDELIEGMVRDALTDQSVYGYANLYADDFGDFSMEQLNKNLKGSHYLQDKELTEEIVATTTLGDYSHDGGGLAGNAFYNPQENKKHKSDIPKMDYTKEESYLRNIIRSLIEDI